MTATCFWLPWLGNARRAKPICRPSSTPLGRTGTGVIANLLNVVFRPCHLPAFDARLIELVSSIERRGGPTTAFSCAGSTNAHPLVREFALTELRTGVRDGSVVALFINNYRPGDEQAHSGGDGASRTTQCELHWLLMDVDQSAGEESRRPTVPVGVIAYASTPCENCRYHAARLLLNQQVAPAVAEGRCRHDSAEDCRELA